jgi:transcriptional regulator with XRE-family HTH domain
VGISRSALIEYERGDRVPKTDRLSRIAETGGSSIDWLLNGRIPRARVRNDPEWEAAMQAPDPEGFPFIPGRYGVIEWFDGRELAVYSDHPRLFAKIWAIPGVRRNQTGDQEMRAIFPREALEQVAAVIRAKRWGGSGRGRPGNLVAGPGQMRTSTA